MALNTLSGAGRAIRRLMAKARAVGVHLIYERTVLLLAVMFCAAVGGALWHLSRLSSVLVESGALLGTSLYSESLTELRTFYNTEVVQRVRPHGIDVTHDYSNKEGAIPIPATFSIEFGKRIGEKDVGMQIRLYSDYPFPFRKDGGPRDDFQREALAWLRKYPDKPFVRFEDFQGRPSLRYATAIPMQAGCVSCHNTHPESPKTDWRVGDVRGVQEITRPLGGVIAQTRAGLRETFILLATMGFLGLGGLALAIRKMRRTSSELEQRVAERTAAEARLAGLHEINLAATSTLDLRTVLKVLLEKIDFFLPYSAATVRLFNRESGMLEPVACSNLNEEEWKAEQWRGGRGIPNVVFEKKAPWMVSNVQTDPRVRDREFFRKHGLVSYLGVPLTVKDEVLGVLSFYTKEAHKFSSDEVEFLSTLAGQAAIAIHNSQLYEGMKNLAEELTRSNKVRGEFLSVMSHELRTPLNVIMGYSVMVKEKMLGEINHEQEKVIGKVIGSSKDLLVMINGILEATKIEAGAAMVRKEEVSLSHFLDAIKTGYEMPLGKNLSIGWNYPCNLPIMKTDGDKLRHILQNLINNALKFTEQGSVTVSARIKEGNGQQASGDSTNASRPTPQAFFEFKVADTGVGIPEDSLPAIFEKFRQIDSSETRVHGGVGLGLYIVKKFTELLGGEIEVQSEPGKGSTFTVTIPCESYQSAISSGQSVGHARE